ncbi:MAG: flagellar basal body-associated FliL family protein [Proteobacteria bacterium]|nr:flagellar basal body-associated FliL family protein [Pseudomonadota bacterium]
MSEQEENEQDEAPPRKSAFKGLLFSALSVIVLAGAALGVVYLSPFGDNKCSPASSDYAQNQHLTKGYDDIKFVNLEPLVITLGPNADAEFLKISVSIETTQDHVKAAKHLQPRFRDVLNTYLRAIDENDLVEPAAMTRIRAQMLRRLQVAASREVVTDLLITDFVLN